MTCPKGEHVHRDGTRWPTGGTCGGDERLALPSTGSVTKGYPCPKDGSPLVLLAEGAWCPVCRTAWREVDEISLADLDALPERGRGGAA